MDPEERLWPLYGISLFGNTEQRVTELQHQARQYVSTGDRNDSTNWVRTSNLVFALSNSSERAGCARLR